MWLGPCKPTLRGTLTSVRADPPLLLERDTSFEECQSQGLLHILPEWQKDHPDRVYLWAPCFVHRPEPLELHALKEETSGGDQ